MIETAEQHARAVERIKQIFAAKEGTPEAVELDGLVRQVMAYEEKHFPMGLPSLASALEFRMDQMGWDVADMAEKTGLHPDLLGSILEGSLDIGIRTARVLHRILGISADVLLQDPVYEVDEIGNRVRRDDGSPIWPSRSRYETYETDDHPDSVNKLPEYIVVDISCTDGYSVVHYADGSWQIWHETSSVGQELIAVSAERQPVQEVIEELKNSYNQEVVYDCDDKE